MSRYFFAVIFAIIFILSSCSSSKKDLSDTQVGELYNQGLDDLNNKKYKAAVKSFEELEQNYPYSIWATRAQLLTAYSYYQDEQYDEAVTALESFIKLHPGNKDIAYAYYLKAMCYYDQISTVTRDQLATGEAYDALKEVTLRFPDTEYGKDAKVKLDLSLDHLAGKELDIGRFYLKRQRYIAAINRFNKALADYQTTSHTPEALYRLVESYTALGIENEAKKYAAVLGYNYPGSKWYSYAYNLILTKFSNSDLDKPGGKVGNESHWWNVNMPKVNIPFFGQRGKKITSPPQE